MSTVALLRQSTVLVGLVLALAGPVPAGAASVSTPVTKLTAEATEALRKGDLKQAIEQFTAIIGAPGVAKVDKAKAELNRGLAYQRQGLHAKAAEDYTKALEQDLLDARTRAVALYNRGLAYRKLNQPGLAVDDFTAALFLDSNFGEAYMSRGLVMRENKKPYYALSDFYKAIESNFGSPHLAYFARAMVFEELGRVGDAKNELNRALMAKPDFTEARAKLASLNGGAPIPDSLASAGATENSMPAIATQRVASLSTPVVTGSVGGSMTVSDAAQTGDLPKAVFPPAHLLEGSVPEATATAAIAAPQKIALPASAPAQKMAAQPVAEPAEASARLVATTSEDATAKPVQVASAEPGFAIGTLPNSPVADKSEGAKAVAQAVSGWLIQLSSAENEGSAWGVWKRLSAKHDALKDYEPVVMRADLGAKGVFYRLRLAGFDSRKDADKTCRSLKSRGLSCFVTKAD
ncbi:SPOR domain-containing protein [Rhodoligotrophos ferricapiens]|uniref:SPOR domain-containing protein n=1 Tax=Rhodoligotrophos ferricapiens TaxID=3069264 RepID=UPI00315CA392